MTGVAVVGMLPRWRRRIGDRWRKDAVHDLDKKYAEAVRRLQVTIRLSPRMSDPNVITMTSAAAACGKSAVCISLARAMARIGRKVLLVNADPGAFRGGKTARRANDVAFGEAISGERPFDQIVQTDPASAVHIVTVAATPDTAHKLLGSEAFETLLTTLRKKYDAIIIDAPPVTTSAEAALVGQLSDAILFVVRWRANSYIAVIAALRQLDLCGLKVAGLVLSRIDGPHQSEALVGRPQSHPDERVDFTRVAARQHTAGLGPVIRAVSSEEISKPRIPDAHRTGTDRP